MKLVKFCVFLLTYFLLVSIVQSQRRNKWRKKKDPKRDCHLKIIEKCYNEVDEKSKNSDRHLILKTADGHDELCR